MTQNSFDLRAAAAARMATKSSRPPILVVDGRTSWEHLVFDMDRGDPRARTPDGAEDVELVAEAGVAVADQRDIDRVHDAARVTHHFGHGGETVVGIAERHGRAGAGHVDGGEAGLGDGAAGDAVDGAGGHDHLLGGEQLAEIGGVGHGDFLSHLRLFGDGFVGGTARLHVVAELEMLRKPAFRRIRRRGRAIDHQARRSISGRLP
jgi:hypothetical protein